MNITLNKHQTEVYESEAKETHFIGGLGSGKSFILAAWLMARVSVPGSLHLHAAPTYDVLRNSLRQVQGAWKKMGILENIHYVVNERPPEDWGVPVYSKISSSRVITFRWGSYVLAETMENFDKVRSAEFDSIVCDEFRDVKEEARIVLLGRLRGPKFVSLGKKIQILFVTTPPENPKFYKKLIKESEGKDMKFVYTTTFENQANLPDDYIDTLRDQYDTDTFRREVLGQFVSMVDRPFLYSYDSSIHVGSGLVPVMALPIWLSFDFNKDPLTCIALQTSSEHTYVLHEFEMQNGDIYELCKMIRTKYPQARFIVTGDASGKSRSVLLPGNANNYTIIKKELKLKDKRFKVRDKNLLLSESRTLVNSVLEKHGNFKIDESCRYLLDDIETASTDERGKLKKDRDENKNDFLDCFRYAVDAIHWNWLKKKH